MATRATIRTAARARADQDSSTFPTDAQYNVFIDEAGRETWYDLIQAGWPISFSTVDKTATGSQAITLGVSGTIAFVRGVYRKDGTVYTELRRLNEGQRASLMSQTGTAQALYYNIMIDPTAGPQLELFPVQSSGTYRVEYIPEWPGFSADGDTWYGPARSDELVSIRAAIKGLRKEGDDQGALNLEAEYERVFEKVTAMASWFDLRNPPVIRDVNSGLSVPRDAFDYDVELSR